jgi:pimeloyl-ACP methyl ester carboxylesterase
VCDIFHFKKRTGLFFLLVIRFQNMTLPIILLHGLGERTWTMGLFVWYLNFCGWDRVYTPHWPANTCRLTECIQIIDKTLPNYISREEPFVVIGNSMGGVMANYLHTCDWNITASISVASPLNGARLYRFWEYYIPLTLFNIFHLPGYDYLRLDSPALAPPHPYHTFSFSFLGKFDGNVFGSDAKIDDKHHTSLDGMHWSLGIDPFAMYYIAQQVSKFDPSVTVQHPGFIILNHLGLWPSVSKPPNLLDDCAKVF